MKLKVFKGIKKIILFCTVFISCFVISLIPCYASSLSFEDNLKNGNVQVSGSCYSVDNNKQQLVFPTRTYISDYGIVENCYTQTLTFAKNTNVFSNRLNISSVNGSTLFPKYSTVTLNISDFLSYWVVQVGPSYTNELVYINKYNSVYVYIRDKVTQKYTSFEVSDWAFGNYDLTFSFTCPVDADAVVIGLRYDVNDFRDSVGFTLYSRINNNRATYLWFHHENMSTAIKINGSFVVPPLSEQPIYSSPQGSGTVSSVDRLESELVDSTNSLASQQQDEMFDLFFDRIDNFSVSISAFRNAFNYFVDSHPVITFICVTSLITGIILLFSSFSINRGGKG